MKYRYEPFLDIFLENSQIRASVFSGGVKTAGLEVIALLQNKESGEIISANKSVLEPHI